jgi:hypothetical protein
MRTKGMTLASVAVILVGLALAAPVQGTTAIGSNYANASNLGAVKGIVVAGPATPVCTAGKPCNVNMTGYTLVFVMKCRPGNICQQLAIGVGLSSNGHYSVRLPTHAYQVTLEPCPWLGCHSVFPTVIAVKDHETTIFDAYIDTGIR